MKRIVTIFSVLFIALSAFGQVNETFSDGDDWTNRWEGNTDKFIVNDDGQLQSNTGQLSSAASYYVSTASTLATDCEWDFWVNAKFALTSANYIDLYLVSDNANLKATNINGYFVRIGDTDKKISLYKKVNGVNTEVIVGASSVMSSSNNNLVKIRVKRQANNSWTLEYDKTGTGASFVSGGSFADATAPITTSTYMGIYIQQSTAATPANNHFFDNIYAGTIIVDTTSPTVDNLSLNGNNQIIVTFSESIAPISTSNFSLSENIGEPISASLSADAKTATLTFANDLAAGDYILTMNNITDLAGNSLVEVDYDVVVPEKVYLVQDDFSDGDFTDNPTWSGSVSSFIVNDDKKLQSNASTAGLKTYLSTQYNLANNCEWDFWVNLKFNPSSTNYVDLYLISDKADLTASNINGYFVRIGTADDKISLYKRTSASSTPIEIITGTSGVTNHSENTFFIKVTRDANNVWKIKYDPTGVGNSFINGGTVTDASILTSSYMGIYIAQSGSTSLNQHYFDNIYAGPIIPDTTPPTVMDIAVNSSTEIEVSFSESINPVSTSNFNLSSVGAPNNVVLSADESTATLTYDNELPVGNYTLSMNNITDLAGNPLQTLDYQVTVPEKVYLVEENFSDGDFTNNPTWYGDTESFTIEDEMLKLNTAQNKSYLSTLSGLVNNCEWDFWVNLKFDTSDNNYTDIYLMSNKQNLLATNVTGYFIRIGTSGDNISLYKIVNGVSSVIINGANKVSNTTNNFIRVKVIRNSDNSWEIRYDPAGGTAFILGGTAQADDSPILNSYYMGVTAVVSSGNFSKIFYDDIYAGSIIIDTTPPDVQSIVVNTSDTREVKVIFTEGVQPLTPDNFTLSTGEHPMSVTLSTTDASATLIFANAFIPRQYYTLIITNLIDLDENPNNRIEYTFGVPEFPTKDDLIINEIMFNNPDAAEEYVEIYNKSDKILDVSGVLFGPKKSDGTISSKAIANGTIMMPYSYLALCKTPEIERSYFQTPDTANFVSMTFTALNNDGATIVLYKDVIVFDTVAYSSKWHNPIIQNKKGVALERINPNMPSSQASSWTSAAADVNYGTPGYKNSQYTDINPSTHPSKDFWLDNDVFTPNNDGINDVLLIHYKLPDPSWTANITIYDAVGQRIKKLYSNYTLSTEGTLTWDGSTDKEKLSNIGIYVIYIEIFNMPKGETKKYKLPAVVSGKK